MPTEVHTSLMSMLFYVRGDMFDSVPRPNKCRHAQTFVRLCLGLVFLVLACNLACLALLFRAERIRRAAVKTVSQRARGVPLWSS